MMGAANDSEPKERDLANDAAEYTASIKASYDRLRELRLRQLAANGDTVIADGEPDQQEQNP
jgi:hypothetical protein